VRLVLDPGVVIGFSPEYTIEDVHLAG